MKMMFYKYRIFLFALLMAGSFAVHAESFNKDEHYFEVFIERPVADPARVEVLEFFWYACPHCYSLEPHINAWMKTKSDTVDFSLVPATFKRPNVILHAKTFYALRVMGVDKQLHEKIFYAIHQKKNRLKTQTAMESLLAENGVSVEAYRKAMKSFAVNLETNKARELAQDFEIRGVPALVVGGKYRTASMEGSKAIKLVNFLIDKVAKEQAEAARN